MARHLEGGNEHVTELALGEGVGPLLPNADSGMGMTLRKVLAEPRPGMEPRRTPTG